MFGSLGLRSICTLVGEDNIVKLSVGVLIMFVGWLVALAFRGICH